MNYLQGNLILRYLANQCSTEEREELAVWLSESPQNENTLNYLRNRMQTIF